MNIKVCLRYAFALVVPFIWVAPATALTVVNTGNITTGAQFDLYTLDLRQREIVHVSLVCDDPFTLDTVLTVFTPGSDPSDTGNAFKYNDDGGTVVCGGFRSSDITFDAPIGGTYTFRADGFGSSTGPYTMTIETLGIREIPTLGVAGLVALCLMLVLAGAAVFASGRRRT
ncbi:MAG: hypothetical protein EPO03_02085 [Porticoccaceae bacterium]|nr:MAG: hypothetical protein EPO03_02085 [Porticoccaceae bacterium]